MNKTLTLISLLVALTLTSCQNSLKTNQPTTRQTPVKVTKIVPPLQPSLDTAEPEILPTTIANPILLEAWTHLYNSTRTCELWDGYTLTGQELARYVIDQGVVVAWNDGATYVGSYADRGNTKAIYINPGFKEETETQMIDLVSDISHELFHDLSPFNQNADTLYEEYWAFYVGACVSGQSTEDFKNTSPLSSTSLTQWFEDSGRSQYIRNFDKYPENALAISKP